MRWEKYNNQEFKVGDLLWLEKGKFAFVDGNNANEPSSICSIPESWSFDLNVKYENIQSGLNKKGEMYDILGVYVDRILLYSPYPEPTAKKIESIDGRYDYVELTFYKQGGKMNYVEYMLIPLFLEEAELKGMLNAKYGSGIFNNDIVVKGEYYNRLIKAQF